MSARHSGRPNLVAKIWLAVLPTLLVKVTIAFLSTLNNIVVVHVKHCS